MTTLLPDISQRRVQTERLEVAYLEAGEGATPVVLVHGNCSSSTYFQDFMLGLASTGQYRIFAPDLRGYGDTEPLPLDGTRGVKDFSDDLAAFVNTLKLPPFNLFGWSLGGNIVMQYAIDYPEKLRSLTLQAPGSPFGFGGTKEPNGIPTFPDFAGSGGGTVNPAFVESINKGDRSSEAGSPRFVMNNFYFKPPFKAAPDREEMYLDGLLSTRTGPANYPGDMTASDNWPNVAPGTQGLSNALAPKYLNQAIFAEIKPQVPVLWLRGADDQIVSDTSFFEMGFLGQVGAVPGWPGAEVYPAQPMVMQTRYVLDKYKAKGGTYQEVVLPDCGHSPHIEKAEDVLKSFTAFIKAVTVQV